MNFLAHLYLSGEDPKIKVGNFIGDFVKGSNLSERFESSIARGIELHRGIDEFTDTHPVVTQSKERLRPRYRHYSPVIVDMFYDHFLARNWTMYHEKSLTDFATEAYDTLRQFHTVLPEEVKYVLGYMERENWLVNYGQINGIRRALSGMARRTSFDSKMEQATQELEAHYTDFEQEFHLFFPDLKKFSENFLENPTP